MGFFAKMRQLEKTINEAKYGSYPHDMNADDYAEWDRALDLAQHRPQTKAQVQQALRRVNPIRYRQVESDIQWVRKHLEKMGLNPEDWRVLL